MAATKRFGQLGFDADEGQLAIQPLVFHVSVKGCLVIEVIAGRLWGVLYQHPEHSVHFVGQDQPPQFGSQIQIVNQGSE